MFLWSTTIGETQVFLLGSIHVLKHNPADTDERVERAYQSCSRIVFEADMDEMALPETRMMMVKAGLLPEGETLDSHIGKETKDLLQERLESSEFGMDTFIRFRPWLTAVTLTAHELKRLGFDVAYGIDTSLYCRAKRDGKDSAFLETAQAQIETLSSMPEAIQEDLLMQTLHELAVIEERSSEIVSAWERGDAQALEEITTISLRNYPSIYERLFVARNRNWVDRIEMLIENQKALLVVVGAAHLVGDHGILALLREKGYTAV